MSWKSGTDLFERVYSIITSRFEPMSELEDGIMIEALAELITAFEYHDWDSLGEVDDATRHGTWLNSAAELVYPDWNEE